jgi:septal ring factor EnvC (AmiA/AmiB activator)
MENAHATAIADLGADHLMQVQNLEQKLEDAERAFAGAKDDAQSMKQHLKKAEEEIEELRTKLEQAASSVEGGSASEQKLKDALRKAGELQDELEGTKTVSYPYLGIHGRNAESRDG